MKRVFISVAAALISLSAAAQEASLLKLDVEARVDYMQMYINPVKRSMMPADSREGI